MADKTFVMRLALENGEVVVRGLDEIGDKGEAAGRKIRRASEVEASPGLRAMSAASNEANAAITGLANRAGPLGTVLMAIGPAGLVAAAAIGLIGVTAVAALRQAGEAASRFDDLADTASRLGTTAGELVKWRTALGDTAGSMEDFAGTAEDFEGKIGALLAGVGRNTGITQALSAIGVSREQLAEARTLEERLLLIAEGISKVENAAQRAGIADKLGLRAMLPLLEQGREGVLKMLEPYQDIARAADEGVARTGAMADEIAKLDQAMQLKKDNLFVRLAPLIIFLQDQVIYLLDLMNQVTTFDPTKAAWANLPIGEDIVGAATAPGGVVAKPLTAEQQRIDDEATKLQMRYIALTNDLVAARKSLADLEGPELVAGQRRVAALQAAASAAQIEYKRVRDSIGKEFVAASTAPPPGVRPPRQYDEPGDLLVPAQLDAEAKAAQKAAEAYADLARARADWRNDPAVFGESRKAMEDIAAEVSDEVKAQTDALDKTFQEGLALRESFRPAFTNAFVQLANGDARGALEGLADHFTQRLYSGLADALFDNLFPSMGGGGGGTDIWGSILNLIGLGGGGASAGAQGGANVGAGSIGQFGGPRALGGPVEPGKFYLVNENKGAEGAEYLVAGGHAMVMNPAQMAAQMPAQMYGRAMLPSFDPAMLMALAGGGGGKRERAAAPVVNIMPTVTNNTGQAIETETKTSQDGRGNVTIETILKPMVKQAQRENVRSGSMDKAMTERSGVRPRLRPV